MIFRVFIESLWYPGRNMNVLNVIQTTPMRGGNTAGGEGNNSNYGGTSGSNNATAGGLSPNNSDKRYVCVVCFECCGVLRYAVLCFVS